MQDWVGARTLEALVMICRRTQSRQQDVLFPSPGQNSPSLSPSTTPAAIRHTEAYPDILTFTVPEKLAPVNARTQRRGRRTGAFGVSVRKTSHFPFFPSCSLSYIKAGCTITLSISSRLPSPPYRANTYMNVGLFSRY